MSREENARKAVQALIPDDEILDVALTYPRGATKAQGVGMAIGGAMGMGSDFQGVGVALGGWDTLQPMITFERSTLRVDISRHLATLDITLVDTEHEAKLELEAKRLGTLDVKALLELIRLSDQHLQDGSEPPRRSD